MKKCKICRTEMKKENNCDRCSKPAHQSCMIKDGEKYYCDLCFTNKQYDKEEIVLPDVIRRSHIQTYLDCEYKSYMELIKGYEQPENIYAKIGIDVHEIIETIPEKNEAIERFREIFDGLDDSWFYDEKQKEKLETRGYDSIDTYYEIKDDIGVGDLLEKKIVFSVGDGLPKVSTTVDRIDIHDNHIDVLDWKTGNVAVGKKLSTDIQVPLYIYGVEQELEKPVSKFTLYYLSENKKRIYEHMHGDIYGCKVNKRTYEIKLSDTVKKVQNVFNRMLNNDFEITGDPKKMHFTCKMCHIKARGLCEGADVQTWGSTVKKGW